jgi:hypothetical protein
MDVLGQQVVLDVSAVFGPVGGDDAEVLVEQQRAALRGYSLAHIPGAPFPDGGLGHEQADGAVDHPTTVGDLGVGLLGFDLVAEEVRRLAGGVGDQGFRGGQFQLELIVQERTDLGLDLLGLVLGTGKAEQEVVALCRASDYAACRGKALVSRAAVARWSA